jgi:hypothetical protein
MKKYNHPEADIRNAIIEEFKSRGIKLKRVENSIGGSHKSIPDLWFFDPITKKAGWMEVKTSVGRLSKGKDSQEEFRDLCLLCHIPYWVVRSVDEALTATGRREHESNEIKSIEFEP